MEQYSHYLMWMKNKHHHILNSPHFDQEQAFAEDAHGPLGGFVWPPRCYSCTFCKREFRSAQALGGHMNVHRRDRAKLKQSLCPQTEDTSHNELFPSHEVSRNSKYSNPSNIFVASPLREKNFSKQTNVPLFSSPIIRSQAQQKELSYVACKRNMRKEEFTFEGHVDGYVETNLSVGLNSGVSSRTRPARDIGSDFKRQKTDDDVCPLPFIVKGCSNDKDNIDLELRLGDAPTVK